MELRGSEKTENKTEAKKRRVKEERRDRRVQRPGTNFAASVFVSHKKKEKEK